MNKQLIGMISTLILGILLGVGGLAIGYLWATENNSQVSQPISAPTLSAETNLEGLHHYQIDPEQSEVRFVLDEVDPPVQGLVGRTSQVAGSIWIDREDPRNSILAPIRINLRNLSTGHRARDTAIRERILLTGQDENEFTEFVPIAVYGLPDTASIGETIEFFILGELAIVEDVHQLLFTVEIQAESDLIIRGIAETTVYRDQLGLLQSFLGERGVSNNIRLEIEFVAILADSGA